MTSAMVGMLLLTAGIASAQGAENPLDGITPNLDVFGGALNDVWARVIAGIWAAVLGAAGINLMTALYKIRKARAGGYQSELSDSMDAAKTAAVAFGAVAAAGVIMGAILFVVNGS
ncbi:hypothetical protein [Rhodococcus artemisiae]|uniref:Interferon-induced transmembrane protein n=1 Tax=Rhodococcus artemisiae TaxID=714159 RepID=A0ABU7LJM6_9NOCA|nr:hypothetical protein [Rhodococcus artemisiae]MEE2061755.1 hypothetical protein [Rhodococcus artemisiae]